MALTSELDVRLYNANGTRKYLPSQWLSTVEFEIAERGGYRNGTLQLLVPWEQLQLTGTEYVDIRLWGQLLYRGFVRQPQNEIAVPERASPTLFGLMEFLNGYLVQRVIYLAQPTDIGTLFKSLAVQYTGSTNRLPGLNIDTAGVASLNILVQTFDAKGKTLSEAFGALCDLAPDELIWGCDVDNLGHNRLYLYPRATTTKYFFAIGREVKAFVYPKDGTRVVNTLYVTGAKADNLAYPPNPPNLCLNGSFEEGVIPGATTAQLLLNPGFEDGGGAYNFWNTINGTTADTVYVYEGGHSADFDNNPSSPEGLWQEIAITGTPTVFASCWAFARLTNGAQKFQIILEARNAGGTVLVSATSGDFQPAGDATWRYYTFSLTIPPATVGVAKVRLTLQTHNPGNNDNVNIDNVALWTDQPLAHSWFQGQNSGASWSLLDWQNMDASPGPYDGELMVKSQATISGGGGSYAELTTDPNNHIQVKQQVAYWVTAWVYASGASGSVALGIRPYIAGAVQAVQVSGTTTIPAGTWTPIGVKLVTNTSVDSCDVLLRSYNGTLVYWDAVGLWQGNLPPWYYPGDTMTAKRSVLDYAGSLPANIANSITTWGVREKAESVDGLTTQAQLDAYNTGYFKAYGDALAQATLTVEGATSPVFLDGKAALRNLPSEPPALAISTVRYQVGETVTQTLDLNNELPRMALLLQRTIVGQPT